MQGCQNTSFCDAVINFIKKCQVYNQIYVKANDVIFSQTIYDKKFYFMTASQSGKPVLWQLLQAEWK